MELTTESGRNKHTSSTDWLSQERLKQLITYDPIEGTFTNNRTGKTLGSIHKEYRILVIGGHHFRAARIAWFYMTGEWPVEVDHKDTCKSNDKWDNLRESTRAQNNCNKGPTIRSLTGIKGVQKLPSGRYSATIRTEGVNIYLGSYDTIGEAESAYNTAAEKFHGEFTPSKR